MTRTERVDYPGTSARLLDRSEPEHLMDATQWNHGAPTRGKRLIVPSVTDLVVDIGSYG
jgi:hypothetical protein